MQTNIPRILKTAIVLGTLGLLAGPLAGATNYGGGSVVTKYDYDYFPKPGTVTTSLCYYDVNNDGSYTAFEPITVDIDNAACATGVETEDIRLTLHGTYKPFTAVKTEDGDFGRSVAQLTGTTLIYHDENANNKFDGKDVMYLDIVNVGTAAINQGDLRLTPRAPIAAGAFVRAGDPDVAWTVTSFGAAMEDANIVYKAGSAYYINADKGAIGTADVGVEDNDVRILAKAPDPFAWDSTSDIVVSNVETSPPNPVAGHAFQIIVAVKNAGKEPAARFVEVTWGGAVVDARSTPILPPGKAVDLVATLIAPDQPGTHDLTVGGQTLAVTVDPAVDLDVLRLAALEHELAALRALLEGSAAPGGDLDVQNQATGRAPAVDPVLALLGVGALALAVRRRRPA